MPKRPSPDRRRPAARRVALALLAAAAALAGGVAVAWAVLPDPAPLATRNPATTALIEQRRAEAKSRRRALTVRQTWISLDRVAPAAVDAILLSEDANFFGHEGIDWEAVRAAAEHDLVQGRFARGASTLTQQLAKNLWLGTEKSLWRKGKEAILASKLERALSKRRILALYVNLVEWGDGVFGIEAGARHRFATAAARLSPAQAAVMASMLPAPLRVDLDRPTTWLKRRSRRLLDRMHASGRLSDEAHRSASAELERILAGPAPADDRDQPPEVEEAAPTAPLPPVEIAPAADPAPPPAAATAAAAAAPDPG
jgi:monofunctional biosynthetic peptidoglycan transglycosylase